MKPEEYFSPKEQKRQEKVIMGSVLLTGVFCAGFGVAWEFGTKLGEMSVPKNPDGQFEVISVGIDKTIIKQDGKEYTISTRNIPTAIKQKLIEGNPRLKSFLENGPITIVDTNKVK